MDIPQFMFYKHPLPDVSAGMMPLEESMNVELPFGSQLIHRWFVDDTKISHVKTTFLGHFYFEKQNPDGVVSLSFNLRGEYEIRQHGNTHTVQKGQHNIIYTRGHSNTFKNGIE